MKKIMSYLKLIRVKHYIKNLLIFLPIIFSGNLFDSKSFIDIFISFIAFSFVCSIVYIINDIRDIEKDRLHSKKKFRPLASGEISVKNAIILLIIISLFVLFLIIKFNFSSLSFFYLFIYLFINILYSFGLKNYPIIDLVILSFGFVIRVLYGASIIDIEVSNWLYLTVMSISFYLALSKRRGELLTKKNTRKVLKYYSEDFLSNNIYMFLGMGIVFYSLWAIDVNIINNTSKYLVWTVPVVIVIVMRYNMIIEGDSDGNPVDVVFNDKLLLGLIMLYCIIILVLIYFI